ncbi:hypothetical protein [Lebetimonas sp. JH292]|nr:hypothetical protein [Lebetimonas sp. JH292]
MSPKVSPKPYRENISIELRKAHVSVGVNYINKEKKMAVIIGESCIN